MARKRSGSDRTIHDVAVQLGMGKWRTKAGDAYLKWPPDVFCFCAMVLRDSGAYRRLVDFNSSQSRWLGRNAAQWSAHTAMIGSQWARLGGRRPPRIVRQCWAELKRNARLPISELGDLLAGADPKRPAWTLLGKLLAYADQASRGIGLPQPRTKGSDKDQSVACLGTWQLMEIATQRELNPEVPLLHRSTVCRSIHPSRAIVLPKMRTPQRGLTIRSLSHHLALFTGANTVPTWVIPNPRMHARPAPERENRKTHNLLIFPHPFVIRPAQFQPIPPQNSNIDRLATGFDFYSFAHDRVDPGFAGRLDMIVSRARRLAGPIKGVIMPEAALPLDGYHAVFGKQIPEMRMPGDVDFFVCGVTKPVQNHELGGNLAIIRCKGLKDQDTHVYLDYQQNKHHRWALDEPQIRTYGLAGSLHPKTVWWEAIALPERELHFFVIDDHCTFSVLICEDLARPDPMGELIRAVGPNLVIALLQDGPQISDRWASRYATALAEDPGSSVLTVTSAGMSKLSRPLAHNGPDQSDLVALWKDSWNGAVPIRLPKNAAALVLSLYEEKGREFSADGRDDGQEAGFVKLGGVHAID